uniref:AT-hook motif nuclear-localized protein n=1 Tax=Araucaria cunninghamii TaxID=56994 RepID=A0A0D6QST1_ARACU
MEGRESTGHPPPPPPSYSSFTALYQRNFLPPNSIISHHQHYSNNNLNPNPNYNLNCCPPANAVFIGGCSQQRAMVSPEQPMNMNNNNNSGSNATMPNNNNNNTNVNANATSSNSPPGVYSECKNPNAIFAHPVNERGNMGSERGSMGMGIVRPDTFKRKRGRPRKYGTDGADGFAIAGAMALGLSSPSPSPFSSDKRAAYGSGKKAQMVALGCAGQGFTAHVITIAAGEDVCKKIMAFMQHGPWAVCVLSANGAVSNATLRQPAMSGGIVTYEGRFEILSLSGSFLLTEVGGTRTRTGGLSVSLAGSDGRVVGGGVGGLLTAASPVQVVVGTFLVDSKKDVACIGNGEPAMHTLSASVSGGSPSPPPVAMQSRVEVSGGCNLGKGCHGEQNAGSCSYSMQPQVLNMTYLQSMDWENPHFEAETKSDTDTALTGRAKSMDQTDGSRSNRGDEEEESKEQNIMFEN